MGEEIEAVDGIAVRSEKLEFDASEMRACAKCGRPNPPNRAACIYCGAGLAVDGVSAEPKLQEVEPWEKAFNIVLVGQRHASDDLKSCPVDAQILRRATDFDSPTPLGRAASGEAAEAVRAKLEDLGFDITVLSDEDLAAERPPVRLRSLMIDDGRFVATAFNTGERLDFPADSLELIVVGRLFEERAEQTLKRGRKGMKELDARSISKDSGVVDIYFAGAPDGFRIMESGFDFSCLGGSKSIIASENMVRLVDLLRSIASRAAVSNGYVSKRSLLELIWPSQTRNDSKGVQISRFGLSLARADVTSNTEQFTKYSRLVRRTL